MIFLPCIISLSFLVSSITCAATISNRPSDGYTNLNVKTNGINFDLGGKPWTFAGTNACWVNALNTSLIDETVRDLSQAGYKVMRSWAFGDWVNGTWEPPAYFQSWNKGLPTINYGPNGLQILDAIVHAAEKNDIKVIFTLTNNWIDYGGMDTYVSNLGPAGSPHDLFYRDPRIISYFKYYVANVVSRYKNSTSILAWELANEARCLGTNLNVLPMQCNTSVITQWADEMSRYIKSLDSNHLVSFGGEGYFNWPWRVDWEYNGSTGQDFDALLALPGIDFGTVHLYPSIPNNGMENARQYLVDHNTAAIRANKPFILEEYGFPRADQLPNRREVLEAIHDFELYRAPALNGDLLWSYANDAYRALGGLPNDTYGIYPQDADYKPLVLDFARKMNGKADTAFVGPAAS